MIEPRSSADVAVIGGGIVGLSCARELASAGLSVTVFEMAPRRGASWAAAGMLSPWAESPAGIEGLESRVRALSLYPSWTSALEAETAMKLDVARCGSLVISEPGEEPAPSRLACVRDTAPGFRVLTEAEARAEAPLLHPEIGPAVLLPEEGYADPTSIMRALQDSCRARGVTIRQEPVLRLLETGSRVAGVTTPSGETRADTVVNAAGAWAGPFLQDARVRPVRGQLIALRPPPGGLRPHRLIQSTRGYIVPRGDGSVVVGGTSEEAGFDARVTAEGVRSIFDWVLRTAPVLRGWTFEEGWSGLRPFREGGELIGPDPERRGLFHVVGLYRHGILLAPYAAGRIRQEIAP